MSDFWVDVFNSETRPILQRDDVHQIWTRTVVFPGLFAHVTQPCTPETSLVRQANNIMASIRHARMAPPGSRASTVYPVVSILCFLATMQWPTEFGIVPDIDLEAILGDLVAPRIPPDHRFHKTLETWTKWERVSYLVCRRGEPLFAETLQPKYFVGMVVSSDNFDAACVIDWTVSLLAPPAYSPGSHPPSRHRWVVRKISCTNFVSH